MGKFGSRYEPIEDPNKITTIKHIDIGDIPSSREFIPIEIQDISSQDLLAFSIYFPFATSKEPLSFKKIAQSGSFLNSKWKVLFRENNIEHAYVHVNEFDKYISYINKRLTKTLNNPYLTKEKKQEIIYRNASYVMQRILDDPRSGKNIQMGIDLMNIFSSYLAKNELTASMIARLFSKNYELFSHSIQVALLTSVFCKFLNKDSHYIFLCGLGALLHDIGKVDIPQEILLKNERLSEKELAVIKQHPELGAKILQQHNRHDTVIDQKVIEVVLQHHERADGSGYPKGLTLEEISPMAQIVHIIDCYDTLTTNKAHKAAVSPFEALKIMITEMKETFNQTLMKLFIMFLGY